MKIVIMHFENFDLDLIFFCKFDVMTPKQVLQLILGVLVLGNNEIGYDLILHLMKGTF